MPRRKSGGLGKPKAEHTRMAGRAAAEIEHAASQTINRARAGRCTLATLGYAEMQQAIGRYEAHTASGGSAWKSLTLIRDAAHEYNKNCVRDDHAGLSGLRRRRRR
jgi:hypothetical protein